MVYICGTNGFSQTIQFHDITAKKYLILNAKRNESGSKNMVSCLGQGRKWAILSQTGSQVLKASATHLYLNFSWNPHPSHPWPLNIQTKKWTMESGERAPHMKGVGMLIVSLRGVNFGFWSNLGCSNQNLNNGEMQRKDCIYEFK